MNFYNELLKILLKGKDISDHLIKEGIQEFKELLNNQAEIRFYVDGTENFGHQATTVHVMKRMIKYFDYKGSIKVIYQDAKSGMSTPDKLALLLPGLNPNEIDKSKIKYETCNDITFLKYKESGPPSEKIKLGFTGGADNMDTKLAKGINVDYFLRLQPYQWEKSDNQIEFSDDTEPRKLEEKFVGIPFKFESETSIDNAIEELKPYTEENFDEQLKIRSSNAKFLCEALKSCPQKQVQIAIWPVYGLHQFESVDELLWNITLSGLKCDLDCAIIIVNFSPMQNIVKKGTEDPFYYIKAFKDDLENKQKELLKFKKAVEEAYLDNDSMEYYSQESLANFIGALLLYCDTIFSNEKNIKIIQTYNKDNYEYKSEDIKAFIEKLTNKDLIIIDIGPVPVDVYNYFYLSAGMPGIFEGQGTSSLVISAGKPFFQIPKSGEEGRANYPSTFSSEKNYSEISKTLVESSICLRTRFDPYLRKVQERVKKNYGTEIDKIIKVINDSNKAKSNTAKYFSELKEFFSQDIHEKLMFSLAYMYWVVSEKEKNAEKLTSSEDRAVIHLAKEANDKFTLEEVYDSLTYKWSDGGVDLFDALPDSYLAQFFGAIVDGPFIIEVAKNNIVKEKDSGGKVVKVSIINGLTTAFGSKFNVEMDFTSESDSVISDIKCRVDETWGIDGVPWIEFENPGFDMRITEALLPVQGALVGKVKGTDLVLKIKYPVQENQWLINGSFKKPLGIASFYQMAGGVNLVQSLPPPLNSLSGFGLSEAQIIYDAKNNSVSYMLFIMTTDTPWEILSTPKFEVKPGVNAVIYNPGNLSTRSYLFEIIGDFKIGEGTISINARYPDFQLTGTLTEGHIQLSDLVCLFVNVEPDLKSSITDFNMYMRPADNYYTIKAAIESCWSIPSKKSQIFTITGLDFNVEGKNGKHLVYLSGSTIILPNSKSASIDLTVSATYVTDSGWTLEGRQTSGVIAIGDLIKEYLGWEIKQKYGIDGLGLTIETKTNSWEFTGKADWHIDPLDMDISGSVKLGYNGGSQTLGVPLLRTGKAEMLVLISDGTTGTLLALTSDEKKQGYYGEISADIKWNNIDLLVSYNFDPDVRCFEVIWGIFRGEIKGKDVQVNGKTEKHQIATLDFTQSTTLGSMIETMVSWATGSKFSLGAPWNVLDKIPLTNFEIEWDFTDETVKFKVNIGPIDLGFVTITSICLCYDKDPDDPSRKRVMVDLDASFVWEEKIPAWDATKPETTPSANGSGNKYLDLRLLAMGQHVTFEGFKTADTVQKAIECMEKLPEPKPDEIPAITFKADSSWLFGADFGVLRIDKDKKGGNGDSKALMLAAESKPQYVLTLQTVFNDPNLYALRIALEGDAAKIFKGLDFQIMYRKLSDSIGVYSSEITLPDAMRCLTIGAYSITLPVFGIEIYTNGDFKVDIGFPWNEDFSRSFSIEAIVPPGIPLLGSGGIYFGKIPQVAADNIPVATNGHFNPILVLGFGAQLGLGKSIEYGILKAGFSLTIFGILEGLLAKWNPYEGTSTGSSDSLQIQGEYYFWMQGTFGVIGKIFGSVDFSVIKADVDITIQVYAQITFASYEPIPISVVASVDATASLTIHMGLFKIHLHFSFSVRIKETVTIGALQNPADAPWKVEGVSVAMGRLAAPLAGRLRDHGQALMALPIRTVTPDWSRLLQPAVRAELNGYMAFALTVAGDRAFDNGHDPDLSKQEPCYIASMFIESVPAATEGDNSGVLKAAGTKEDPSFETLAKLVARWAIASIQTTEYTPEEVDNLIVHDDELKALLEWLDDPQDRPIPIPTDTIETFLSNQVQFTVSMPLEEKKVNATFFPMALPLTLERAAYGDVPALKYNLGDYNAIQSDFISWLRTYFDQLAVHVKEESGNGADRLLMDLAQGDISVANFVFADYFVLIMRQMLQAFREGLRCLKQPIADGDTGNNVVTWVNDTGGLQGKFTLHDLFEGNADHELSAGCTLTLPNVTYTVQAGDTLRSVAAAHGISIKDLAGIGENGDIKDLFSTSDPNINLLHLPQFQVGELIKEAQRVKALEHLSCMVSRYYFHGLRLPTEKITPKQEGIWVTRDSTGALCLPATAGLFALTGQQMAIPPLGTDPLTFSITCPASDSDLPWLQFGGGAQTLSFSIQPSTDNCKHPDSDTIDYCRIQALRNFATQNPLDTRLQSFGAQIMVTSHASTYPLSSSIPCQSATPITYPTGGALEGDRPRLWYLPKAMLTLPRTEAPETDPCPCFLLQTHHYDEATGATSHSSLNHYGWATAIEFTIKRLPQNALAGAYQSTYEIMGAGGREVVLLERIIRSIQGNDSAFSQLILGYRLNSDKDAVLRAETGSQITMGISQVNLSTVAHPPGTKMFARLRVEEMEKSTLLNTPSEFIRLLWEASITRAGGFYLYYYNNVDGGLPDAIFNDKGEAEVTLIVIYASNQNKRLRSYMNSVLIGDPVTMSTNAVVAQTVSSQVTHKVESRDSLNSIATRYYSTVLSLAQLNPDMAFATGKTFTLTNGTYLVQESINPGGKLAAIAEYFAMKAEDIKKVNPRITDERWTAGLPPDTAIRLPKTGRTVGTHPGGTTLQNLAAYYGSNSAAIAGENRFVVGLLASGQELAVATGPLMQVGCTPPDVRTIGASRAALPEMPDDPTSSEYARDYLLYVYTMLGFSVVGNQDFIASNMGLPLGPLGKPASDDMDKIRVAKPMNGTDPLEYSKSIPYAKLLSEGHGKPATDVKPYQSNGRLLQINYAWNDLYGNRLITKLDQGLTNGMNTKTPILTGYTDTLVGLSQWPSTSTHWTVAASNPSNDSFLLTTIIMFDASPFKKTEGRQSDAWQTRALTALATYDLLLNQLNDPNGISIWFETSLLTEPVPLTTDGTVPQGLLDWLTAIQKFLKACYDWKEGDPPPEEPTNKSISLQAEAAKEKLNKKQIFKTDFQFIISRTQGIAEGDFAAIPTVQRIATPVPPITTINVNGKRVNGERADKPGLDLFAKNIENTLSVKENSTLTVATVATGVDRFEADAGGSAAAVWIVRLGKEGISFSIIDQNSPQIFAPRPVFNKLITKSATIYDYSSADDFDPQKNEFTRTRTPRTLTFTDIELDKWVRQLFSSIDNLLSPEYVSSMLVIDSVLDQQPTEYPKFLKSFNDQKKALAAVARNLMSPVYKNQQSTRLASAQEALYQELLVKLSNLYSTRAAVSFGARVNADISETGQSPKLYGNVVWAEKSDLASQITLTSPKLDLQTKDDVALTFLVEAPAQVKSGSAGVLPAISLNLCFEGSAIEHQIAEVPGIEDYKASSWLTLIRPETAQKLKAQLGQFEIPMFVRSFPLSPRMDVQTGKATCPEATDLGKLTSWDYGFAYSQDFHYPQDRIHGKVEYNLQDRGNMLRGDFGDAFQALAQFAHAQPNLEKLLKETVPGIDATTTKEQDKDKIDAAAKVLGAFLKMVTDVVAQAGPADRLSFKAPLPALKGDAALTYRFYIEENKQTFTPNGGTDKITAWVVTIVSANEIPPTGLAGNPRIDIEGVTTHEARSLSDPLKGIYAYWYEKDNNPLAGDKAQVINDRTMVLPGMHILQRQDAKATVYMKRNEELVKGCPSDESFVYQTPEVTFSNPLHPTIASNQPVNIAKIDNPESKPRSLKEHLTALFTKLFKNSPEGMVTIQVDASYNYTLNDDLSDLYVPVPILLQPPLTCTIGKQPSDEQALTLEKMIDNLAQGIQHWFKENNPDESNAILKLKLSIMSNLTRQPMPLLTLTNLSLSMGDIVK